jgi:hypothetical protein
MSEANPVLQPIVDPEPEAEKEDVIVQEGWDYTAILVVILLILIPLAYFFGKIRMENQMMRDQISRYQTSGGLR